MDAVGKLGAEKVVYVSCNPETLARDVRYMKKLGYRAAEAWLVDMVSGDGALRGLCGNSSNKIVSLEING